MSLRRKRFNISLRPAQLIEELMEIKKTLFRIWGSLDIHVFVVAQGNDILRFIINSGRINIKDVQNSMEAMKREELLKKHPYKIWEGKDDKWYTYIPDEEKGRVLRKKATKKR